MAYGGVVEECAVVVMDSMVEWQWSDPHITGH